MHTAREQPKPSELVQDLEGGLVGVIYRCNDCSHAYVVTGLNLNGGSYHIGAYDLTNLGRLEPGLIKSPCLEAGLTRTHSLSVKEAGRFADYQTRQAQQQGKPNK